MKTGSTEWKAACLLTGGFQRNKNNAPSTQKAEGASQVEEYASRVFNFDNNQLLDKRMIFLDFCSSSLLWRFNAGKIELNSIKKIWER